jgi:cell division septation protein DedD
VSAEHDDPHVKAARAVHSLRRLMNCYGDVVHVGSVTEDMTAKVFWRRFGLNQGASQSAPQPRGGSGGVKVVERANRDVKNLPAEDRHLLAAAAMLVHGNVLEDVCTAAGALVRAGVLEPGSEFVRHGGSFGVYHAVGAKVTVVTRDRRLADRARALGAAAAAVNGGRVSPTPAALSAAAAAPFVSNPFALSALAAAARQPHASHPQPRGRSPRQPRAARLEAHHPDHWPGWLLTAEQRQGM